MQASSSLRPSRQSCRRPGDHVHMTETNDSTHAAVRLALVQARLDHLCRPLGWVMTRTARSPIFSQSHDFSCFATTRDGILMSTADGIPIHTGGGGFAIRAVLEWFGDRLHDGDAGPEIGTVVDRHLGPSGDRVDPTSGRCPALVDEFVNSASKIVRPVGSRHRRGSPCGHANKGLRTSVPVVTPSSFRDRLSSPAGARRPGRECARSPTRYQRRTRRARTRRATSHLSVGWSEDHGSSWNEMAAYTAFVGDPNARRLVGEVTG